MADSNFAASPPAASPQPMPQAESLIPSDIRPLLGPNPLLRGEDPHEYEALLNRLVAERDPKSLTEYLLVKDEADAVWEERRLRSSMRAIIDVDTPDVAIDILNNCDGSYFSEEQIERSIPFVTQGMLRGDKNDAEAIDQTLASAGLDRSALHAAAHIKNMDAIERLGRLASTHLRRRRDAARELDLHKAARVSTSKQAAAITDIDPDEVIS